MCPNWMRQFQGKGVVEAKPAKPAKLFPIVRSATLQAPQTYTRLTQSY